ncbi:MULTISPECIES: histone deacetylase family protein [unclassified Chelatococcus]|uniref:histone deacetylase family protein n=1 Tax=unclassified Chelatococcus TaxID=2638111 RepID=UPI001BCC3FFE|nr:histone deacetylase family protein [Chelatococcus sp.]MBS7698331.1 histone deacetylase family protein [Chelatococcus sp. YT9]MBX3559188.1 histone deacetylase family protein [Chelatococcus sp.]
MTLYITHPACLEHRVPAGHPERPDRLRAVEAALSTAPFANLRRAMAPRASEAAIARAHSQAYVEAIARQSPREGLVQIDSDTTLSPHSYEAAVLAAGGVVLAVDEVLGRRTRNAFCGVRPPGHHAEREKAMGFCLFNNAAIAARHAREVYGLDRVCIFDWDVHHGNGTQDIFWDDASVLYCSTHEMPLYPGTGARSERGEHDTIVNVPLAAGDDGAAFRDACDVVIFPRISEFKPDLIILSAGFDAHWRDPLASLNFNEDDFVWATREIMALAARLCEGRVVSVLEGGYDLEGLACSAAAHVAALMEET